MSARDRSSQNETSSSSHNVTNKPQTAGGQIPTTSTSSIISSSINTTSVVGGGMESQLGQPQANLTKWNMMSTGDGELSKLSDPGNARSLTPHSSPVPLLQGMPVAADVTPNSTPSSSPRRPLAPTSEPPAKRIKIEAKPTDKSELRKVLIEWKNNKLECVKEKYNSHFGEIYFLEINGNLMDYQNWCRRPPREFMNHIRQNKLEGDDSLEARFTVPNPFQLAPGVQIKTENIIGGLSSPTKSTMGNLTKTSTSPVKPGKGLSPGAVRQKSISTSETPPAAVQQDQMVEKARQEAYVVQRIASLRKEGLWTEKRLPKVHEPPRPKAHWDYLLEEMVWLSADFAQERKWKKAAAKKCARMVQKYFMDKALQAQKEEKEKEMRTRKIAAFIAKEVRTFWSNTEKFIHFKITTKLDEKKKKALDQQLSFIVDQTEKYSSMLAESMNKPTVVDSGAVSTCTTPSQDARMSDDEFQPEEPSDDDEATIAKEDDNPEEQESELQLLQKESEQTIEDLLKDLPEGYFEEIQRGSDSNSPEGTEERESIADEDLVSVGDKESEKDEKKGSKRKADEEPLDEDFKADESEEDDENTIEEQETKEGETDHKKELDELEAENEMSVEELRKKYAELAANAEPMEKEDSNEEEESSEDEGVSDDEKDDDDSDDEVEENEDEQMDIPSDEEEEEDLGFGLETLMEEDIEPKGDREKADKELQDATAAAEALQPKGFTLSSTSVTTPVPFLLKHTLREYQHVGLDWLTTMYEKKLNGILADEMGLGKTIQTISLLAHLACEKRNWGPHLIVVPTSVMLNWEMEFKKWCPAFKILTYYGTQKERKMKRQGWTKPNAFHICITSYKLVIQDHQSFRRKKWKYFILDEAQNIKNFKSQRWQLLLNFQSQRRLLLTGTPLQNNLMELWSLMHFLMPHVFASHREFREWFSNPVTGMIEGNKEYNENIIKRLHKVLRPFILRRLKTEVEQQMPKKFEHVVMCRLSKRQRYLYEEFMARTKTKETLASGNFLSVINVLMQLRKVCNHPNLFEARPTVSPFMMDSIRYDVPSLVYGLFDYDPFKDIDLFSLNLLLADLEMCLTAFAAHRIRKFQASRRLIEEIDSAADPPPKCPAGKIKLHVRPSSQSVPKPASVSPAATPRPPVAMGSVRPPTIPTPTATAAAPALKASSGMRIQLVQQGGTIKAIQVPASSSTNLGNLVIQQTPQGPRLVMPQRANVATPTGTSTVGATPTSGGGLQLLQTASGQLLLTSAPVQKPATPTLSQGISGSAAAALLQRLQGLKGLQGSTITTGAGGRPVLRLPLPANTIRPQTQQVLGSTQNVASTLRTVVPASTPTPLTQSSSPLPTTTASPTILRPNTPTPSPRASAPSTPTKPTTRTELREVERKEEKRKDDERKRSLFYMNDLEERKKKTRKEKLSMISRLNIRKCHACPIYGADLIEAVTVVGHVTGAAVCCGSFKGQGFVSCMHAVTTNPRTIWTQTEMLHEIIRTPGKCLDIMKTITDHFVFVVPSVIASQLELRICHPPPSRLWSDERTKFIMKEGLAPHIAPLHHIRNACVTQFPDPRLIQYDCGKLQTLDRLLRQLKSGSHRVLIFTQMTKMLDVFEAFLNYHGHLYLRLDGTTRVEQRQVLMERFNQDKRIFVFILSTRSGGIGVNLTGADTVIFYDSDWNPTMDAQAQDRCHRIGQTRDVHIYRLISEKTIEENILKKANQKRLLGDLAIEGGNFTTAHFKTSTIQDLFDVNVAENDAAKRMSEVLDKKTVPEEVKEEKPERERVVGAFESALAAAEDESDVQAAKTAKAEAAAELAEFDENLPINEEEKEGQELSKAEQEVAMLMKQLTPIELYALKFLESREDYQAEAERMSAEIEQQKKEWELGRLQALKEEEERLAQSSDEDLLTYSSVDAHNQVWLSMCGREEMPMWHPPTPPRDENDLYIDHSLGFWYDSSIMPESSLPPFYIKKENKRIKIEPDIGGIASEESIGLRRVQKHRREDAIYAPRSLFDRPSPALVKIRQALKHQKYRGLVRSNIPLPGLKPSMLTKPPVTEPENAPEWTINEDWAVVQALQQHLQVELPVNLLVLSPGHTPNWDLVADLVNSGSRCYRSPRHCRARYESTILPREEGKLPPDTPTKKITKKKSGLLSKPFHKSNQMRTSNLFKDDNNSTSSGLSTTRFETIKNIAIKRTPTTKPPLINSTHKNPKHAQVLAESGIQYDGPLSPGQVAANLAERIQRAKQKSQAAAELAQQQKLLQQQQLQLQAQSSASQLQQQSQTLSSQSQTQTTTQQQQGQTQQQQVSVVGSSSAAVQQVVSSGLTTKVATSVVLSQGTAMTVATVTATTSTSTPATSTAATAILSGVRTAVGTTVSASSGRPTLSLQELQVRTSGASPGTAVVSVASLTPAQLTAAKLTATLATNSAAQKGRPLTPQQLQYLKQQAQQRQLACIQQQGKVVTTADQAIKRVQVSQTGRAPHVKPGTVVAGPSGIIHKGVTRTVTNQDVAAALFKQQQPNKSGQMVQVPSAQLLAGLQVQGGVSGSGTPVATLVHTPTCVTLPVSAINVTLPQARVTTAATVSKAGNTQQTVRNIPLSQQILAKPRSLVGVKTQGGLQLGNKAIGNTGLSTVQIVPNNQKQMSSVTFQQIQQVLKQSSVSGTIVGKAVAAGNASGTSVSTSGTQGITTSHTTKLVPMTVSSQQQQNIKQTIQVVSTGGTVVGGGPSIRVSAGDRSSNPLSIQGGTVKVTNPTLLSQVAALQGQPMSIAVRTPTQSPVRIQTSALQTQQTTQAQQQAQQGQQQGNGNGNNGGSL